MPEEDEDAEDDRGDAGGAVQGAAQARRPRGVARSAGLVEVVAGELEEARDRRLLARRAARPSCGRARRRRRGSPRGSARGSSGSGIDAGDVLLGEAMPIGGRPAASGRAPQTGAATIWRSGRRSRGRQQPVRGQADVELDAAVDSTWAQARSSSGSRQMSSTVSAPTSASRRAAACSAYRCSASSRSSASPRSRSHGTRSSSSGADRVAGPAPAVGDVGLDRPEVATAVEDDGERVAERQPRDPQRDRRRGLGLDQRPSQQVVGVWSSMGSP